jgi:hypothetical protein
MKHILIGLCLVLLIGCSSSPSVGYGKNKAANAQLVSDVYFTLNNSPQLVQPLEAYLNGRGSLPAAFNHLVSKAGAHHVPVLRDGLETYKSKDGK